MNSETLSFRPYARLLTMLGEQLIKNERIALVELIKNAYDADADLIEVRFEDFNKNMTPNVHSRIVLRDDGTGMTINTLRHEWMSPATPGKFLAKRSGRGQTPGKKRIIQGEKGIGRFALLKLGREITITTRPRDADLESVLTWDFSRFDDDFLSESGRPKEVFLDQIAIDISRSKPTRLPDNERGTVIEIRNLKGTWGKRVIDGLVRDVFALTDPVSRITRHEVANRLKIAVFFNGERKLAVEEESADTLRALIEERAVLKIRGRFDSSTNTFLVETGADRDRIEVCLDDSNILGLWLWKQRFKKERAIARDGLAPSASPIHAFACGSFEFHFFIFDFAHGIGGRYALSASDKRLLKAHRIYLYRDGVRVYPYGDPDDDWLKIDVTRGIGRAGDFFSNDQIVGWIDITQKENPGLRDKTNREGLIETGDGARDLIFLIKVFLSYLKQYPYARYHYKKLQRSKTRFAQDGVVADKLAHLKKDLNEAGHHTRSRDVARIVSVYKREKRYLSQRAEMTEDLAGVGLSVEMASHDIMLLLTRGRELGRRLARTARVAGNDQILALTDMLVGVLQQVVDGMGDVQVMFKSSRRRRKVQPIEPIIDKIHQIYRELLERRKIDYEMIRVSQLPLKASITDGVVMQVLVNLFDNASYWLDTVHSSPRQMRVTVDGDHGALVFSDNGPGIDPEDAPYIFEPFYSGKGREGRGLGLYIARQLLERHDYRITIAEDHQRFLSGANFVVSFVKEKAQ